MQLRLVALVLGGLAGLPGCAYTTISAPQFDVVRALFPKASPVDFEPLTWSLIWAGEAQPVVPVAVADQFVFTHRSGVEVTFNGWNVTRVAGLLGREVLTLAIGADDVLRIDAGGRQIYAGACAPWERRGLILAQRCEGLAASEIRLDEAGQISRLSFTIHPDYPALVLER